MFLHPKAPAGLYYATEWQASIPAHAKYRTHVGNQVLPSTTADVDAIAVDTATIFSLLTGD
jgi:hypothetical protein